jgi:hypothetical protein
MVDAVDQAHASTFVDLLDFVEVEDHISLLPNGRHIGFGVSREGRSGR